MFSTSQSRWRALQVRCPSSHSAFVYAVLSTRIYCRPTCPARLARRANVKFYDTATAAAAAGFRPCKRCKPEQQADSEEGFQRDAVNRGREIIDRAKGSLTVKEVAKEVGLSPRYFHGVFKRVVGVTPGVYMERLRRMERPTETSGGEEQQPTLAYLEMQPIAINGDQGTGFLYDYFSAALLDDPTLSAWTPSGWAETSTVDESQFDICSSHEEPSMSTVGPGSIVTTIDETASIPAVLVARPAESGFSSAELGTWNITEPSWHELGVESPSLTTDWPFWAESTFCYPYQALPGYGPSELLTG